MFVFVSCFPSLVRCSRASVRNADQHSHACSSEVIDHNKLPEELLKLGYVREAKVLEILRGSYRAWCRPHSTEADRTRSLHLLGIMVRRLWGDNLNDVNSLTSEHYGGFPTKQWLNLLGNADAQSTFLSRLSFNQRQSFKLLCLSTIHLESSFSQIPQSSGSSLKPSASELQGKAHKLDAVAAIKRRQDHRIVFRWSKRKQRFIDESSGGSWNDGEDDGGKYYKDRRARARRYTINRASVRLFNKRRGLEGKGEVR